MRVLRGYIDAAAWSSSVTSIWLWRDALQRSAFRDRPGICGGEEPVGPFLGTLARLAEHYQHVWPADLQFGQPVGDHGGTDAVELEQLRVAVLDDGRRARQRSQIGDLITELAAK